MVTLLEGGPVVPLVRIGLYGIMLRAGAADHRKIPIFASYLFPNSVLAEQKAAGAIAAVKPIHLPAGPRLPILLLLPQELT